MEEMQGKFCKKVLRIPRNAARREAENEIGRDSMTGNIPYTAIKYWISLQQSARAETARLCYDWQVGQPKVECWARRLREELDTVGLVYT